MSKTYILQKDIDHPMWKIPKGIKMVSHGRTKDSAYTYDGRFVLHPIYVENNPEWFLEAKEPENKSNDSFQWDDEKVKDIVFTIWGKKLTDESIRLFKEHFAESKPQAENKPDLYTMRWDGEDYLLDKNATLVGRPAFLMSEKGKCGKRWVAALNTTDHWMCDPIGIVASSNKLLGLPTIQEYANQAENKPYQYVDFSEDPSGIIKGSDTPISATINITKDDLYQKNKPDEDEQEKVPQQYIDSIIEINENTNGWLVESVKDERGKVWQHEYWSSGGVYNHGFCGNSYGYFLSTKIRPNYYQIHSVKRLSDGEVFSVGDEVEYKSSEAETFDRCWPGKIIKIGFDNYDKSELSVEIDDNHEWHETCFPRKYIQNIRHKQSASQPQKEEQGGAIKMETPIGDYWVHRDVWNKLHAMPKFAPLKEKQRIEVEFQFMFPYGQHKGGAAYNLSSPIIIPEEKLTAIKQAIEQVLNTPELKKEDLDKWLKEVKESHIIKYPAIKDEAIRSAIELLVNSGYVVEHQDKFKASVHYFHPYFSKEEVDKMCEAAFNAARSWTTESTEIGSSVNVMLNAAKVYFDYQTYQDYKQSKQ